MVEKQGIRLGIAYRLLDDWVVYIPKEENLWGIKKDT